MNDGLRFIGSTAHKTVSKTTAAMMIRCFCVSPPTVTVWIFLKNSSAAAASASSNAITIITVTNTRVATKSPAITCMGSHSLSSYR